MPEIAEVRVVKDTLKKQILNKKITNVKIFCSEIIVGDSNEFSKDLIGLKFIDINTLGKWIIFNLGEKTLLSHLRMEGKFFYVPSSRYISKHEHVIITLDNGMDLRFQDVRKFGKMELIETKDLYETPCIKKLGYEPEDERLTSEYLLNKFKCKSIPIKSALLDQTIINGLGNIYANEVLHAASINPFRKTNSITEEEAEKIIYFSKKITKRSYELGGCTIRSYTSSLGVIGHFQDELKVHMRNNKPCLNCKNLIINEKIDGRSTYYCKCCQK